MFSAALISPSLYKRLSPRKPHWVFKTGPFFKSMAETFVPGANIRLLYQTFVPGATLRVASTKRLFPPRTSLSPQPTVCPRREHPCLSTNWRLVIADCLVFLHPRRILATSHHTLTWRLWMPTALSVVVVVFLLLYVVPVSPQNLNYGQALQLIPDPMTLGR